MNNRVPAAQRSEKGEDVENILNSELAAWLWMLIGLSLIVAEILLGTFVLLPIAVAVLCSALVAFIGGMLTWQLIALAIVAGILMPISIRLIKPRFTPKGVGYGPVGSGAETEAVMTVVRRDYDDALSVRIKGDYYAIDSDQTLAEGDQVRITHFSGGIASVAVIGGQSASKKNQQESSI